PGAEESIAVFTRRKFSPLLLERLVGPFVSGIYAGDPEKISLRAAFPRVYEAERSAGSVVRGMFKTAKNSKPRVAATRPRRPSLISFRHGNETLVSAIAKKLISRLQCNAAVFSISCLEGGFALRVDRDGAIDEIACQRLVLATPTQASAQLL